MYTFLQDVRLGARQLRLRPLFAVAAIASLALGAGLSTTLFSIVNAVLLKESAIAEPDRLVEVYTSQSKDFPQLTTSYPDYLAMRDQVDVFSGLAAHAFVRGILGGDRPELVTGESVTANYFEVLGIGPTPGRGFRTDENLTAGATPVAVLGYGLWQRRFGGRPEVVGQTMKLSGVEYTIVGVAPRTFTGTIPGIPADFWVPVAMADRLEFSGLQWSTDNDTGTSRMERRGTRWLFVKGRLREGRTIEEAAAQIETVCARLRQAFPLTNEKVGASVMSAASVRFHPMLDGYVKAASAGLLAAVSLVLLIACANVANMLLARGSARKRELAVRAAIGASRGRLIRQLLAEGLVLAMAGGLLGTLIASWVGRALSGVGSDLLPVPVKFDFVIDATVLLFALGVTTATAILFGLAPAWSASRPDLVTGLKDMIAGGGEGPRRRLTLRDALVVAQLALSLVLLVAGALLTRGLVAARSTDLGFDPTPISSVAFNLQMNGYDVDRALVFRDRALRELRALPGVAAVSTASRLPLAPDVNLESIAIPGVHKPGDDGAQIDAASVGADYFTAVGVPIVSGRAFTDDDVRQQRRVVIVNETMARQYWPKGNAVGQRLHVGELTAPASEIVGIARDHKVRSVGEPARPYVHLPAGPSRRITLVVRTSTPANVALPAIKAALLALEPEIVFTEELTAGQLAETTMAATRIGALVMGAFGGFALVLAAVGLYGVIAYSVSLRTREVGIRLALGAERSQVVRLVLAQGGRLAAAGVVVGVAASALVGRVLESLLYGVSAYDPVAYALAAGILLFVAVVANLGPAVSAARIDPIRALRSN